MVYIDSVILNGLPPPAGDPFGWEDASKTAQALTGPTAQPSHSRHAGGRAALREGVPSLPPRLLRGARTRLPACTAQRPACWHCPRPNARGARPGLGGWLAQRRWSVRASRHSWGGWVAGWLGGAQGARQCNCPQRRHHRAGATALRCKVEAVIQAERGSGTRSAGGRGAPGTRVAAAMALVCGEGGVRGRLASRVLRRAGSSGRQGAADRRCLEAPRPCQKAELGVQRRAASADAECLKLLPRLLHLLHAHRRRRTHRRPSGAERPPVPHDRATGRGVAVRAGPARQMLMSCTRGRAHTAKPPSRNRCDGCKQASPPHPHPTPAGDTQGEGGRLPAPTPSCRPGVRVVSRVPPPPPPSIHPPAAPTHPAQLRLRLWVALE